jgi:hypothetical protein
MLRLILIFIVGLFVAVGVLAVALYHFLGVKGLIVFPFVILALLWVAKWVIKNLVKKFALSLFGRKSRALRGAAMTVHSIRVIPEPPEPESEPDDEEDEESEDPALIGSDATSEEKNVESNEKPAVSTEKKEPKDYVELDVTITPKPASCDAFTFWEPTEFILTSDKIKSLGDLEEKTIGDVHSVEVWNGSAFGPDDQGKYPGEQRLKIIFEVKPGSKSGWLCYYHEAIGQLQLPVGTVEV